MEREEIRLRETSEELDHLSMPDDELDAAIMKGYLKGRKAKGRQIGWRAWIYSGMAAAALLFGFVYLVNASPAFAAYVSKVPGMQVFVELINGDKGVRSAIVNEYIEPIGISQEKDGITVTFDAAIKDESGMVLFYTIEADRTIHEADFELKEFSDGDGNSLLEGGAYSVPGAVYNLIKGEKRSRKMDFDFTDFSNVKLYNMKLLLDGEEFVFSFKLEKNAKKEVHTINETVVVDGQAITIKEVTLYPLRADVHLSVDEEQNSKHLYAFEDIRLVDGEGEVWGASPAGMTASGEGEDWHMYLESSYFDRPKELYLEFSRIQALDKSKSTIVIDADKGEILEAPDRSLQNVRINKDSVELELHAFSWASAYGGMNIIGDVQDASGNELEVANRFEAAEAEKGYARIGFAIPDLASFENPITIEVGAYPSWIEEDIRIRVK